MNNKSDLPSLFFRSGYGPVGVETNDGENVWDSSHENDAENDNIVKEIFGMKETIAIVLIVHMKGMLLRHTHLNHL